MCNLGRVKSTGVIPLFTKPVVSDIGTSRQIKVIRRVAVAPTLTSDKTEDRDVKYLSNNIHNLYMPPAAF